MEPLQVLIDTREEELWEALAGWREPFEGWQVQRVALDVGDIVFRRGDQELAILERKTVEDLAASQKDGRYREQRARLLAKKGAGVAVGYVLEAPEWSATLSRTWCGGAFKEVHLQTAVVRLQMRYGLAVFHATSLRETVMWIRRIAGALVADPAVFKTGLAETTTGVAAAYTEALHVKKASNMSSDRVLATLLRTVPGVGNAAADAIVAHVGNRGFPGFYELSEEDLVNLSLGKRKLGKTLAHTLWTTFHKNHDSV
jgi:ERCC4-type nuclease